MLTTRATARAYGETMARVGGRNLGMSWFAGIVCAGIVGALVWLSLPMLPILAQFAGDALRSTFP